MDIDRGNSEDLMGGQSVYNESVLGRMNNGRKMIITIKRRKLEYMGHIMRTTNTSSLISYGKREPGKQT